MGRALHWLGLVAAVLIGLPLACAALLLAALNTGPGQRLTERAVAYFTHGELALSGLAGRFPGALRAARVDLRDDTGEWFVARQVALDWSPSRLLHGEILVDRLAAASATVLRLPASSDKKTSDELPAPVVVRSLHIDRLTLAEPVAGTAATLSADGRMRLASLKSGAGEIALRGIGGEGSYRLQATVTGAAISASLAADEPAHGALAAAARLPDLGALSLRATADGPWSAVAAHATLTGGALTAAADGGANVPGRTVDIDLTAKAPAMAPRPDLAWRAVRVEAHVHGPWTRPHADATASIADLAAGGVALREVAAKLAGDFGHVALDARADGIRLPGAAPDLLAAAPVLLRADAQLDDPRRRVAFTLTHPLLAATGHIQTAGATSARAHLDLPDLAPFAAYGAPGLQGHAAFDLTATEPAGLTADGSLAVTGGPANIAGLLGPSTRLAAAAALDGSAVRVSRFQLDGTALHLAAHGTVSDTLDIAWQAGVPDMSVIAPSAQGDVQGQGTVRGPTGDLALDADLTGHLATAQVPRGPISVAIKAHGLPDAPDGTMTGSGSFDGAPLTLDAAADRQPDGIVRVRIARADWKTLHAEGALALAADADLPAGRITLRWDRLADLSGLLGRPVGGALTADVASEDRQLRLAATARNIAAGGGGAATAALDLRVLNPLRAPDLAGRLDLAGLNVSGIGGTARLDLTGPPTALALQLRSTLTGAGGGPVSATAAARLDLAGKSLALGTLQADWQGETLRLLAPARIDFADGVSVGRARLGVRDAVLDVAGRVAPALDLTATLRNLPVHLLDADAAGTVQGDARLTGPPARPDGRLRLAASGLHLRTGFATMLPPAAFTADATLAGGAAQLTAKLAAGHNEVTVAGTAPLDATGALDLRATGAADLATLNPVLTPNGRRARGHATLDATITGTPDQPRATGTLHLAGGDLQDVVHGIQISGIDALLEGSGEQLRLVRLTGRAGPGTIAASGTIGLGQGYPVDLAITADNARPLATDELTATVASALTLRGSLDDRLTLGGTVTVNRADIRVPERMPASVAVLNVRLPGQRAAPPPAGPNIHLDITLAAPDGRVFIRGRGLDAELQGHVTLAGSTNALQPSGRFTLRSGGFNLAGVNLGFSDGQIGFDGGTLLDPTLNLTATNTTNGITATLSITGTASAPKFTLSSVPQLPQDEILAQLLFHQSASSLSGFQLASAAAALAQISGVGGGFDPLNSIRQRLGLDRLSVGSAPVGNGASLQAGRYVGPGIYVGAKQGTGGLGSQAMVQIDLPHRLKLQATAGTGGVESATGAASAQDPYGTGVGLSYQFDY